MEPDPSDRLEHPPERPRPLLVFDGDCAFCRQWVERWQSITGDRVEYASAQEAAPRLPHIPAEAFRESVWLLEPDGHEWRGAPAVFRLYALIGEKRWLLSLYQASPAFAAAADATYRLIADHRDTAARAVRWLWGDVTIRPSYIRVRSILLRGLGVVYLMAFASLAVQIQGLLGSKGILPAADFLDNVRQALGQSAYSALPTLLWLNASDRALAALCWGGIGLSVLAIVGVWPRVCLGLLWVFYLSISVAGQEFLSFQWDILLLEAGLLGFLLAPWNLWLGHARAEPAGIVVWLFRWLVFRLMLLSGLVKLASGDAAWRAWQALQYHYETQPLPPWTSWYMHQLPPWFHKLSVGYMFWVELVAPFLVFAPRRPRLVAFWSIVSLQILIAATGNYGFFNVLSALLCVALLEDRDLGRKVAGRPLPEPPRFYWPRSVLLGVAAVVIVLVTAVEGIDRVCAGCEFPAGLERLRAAVAPLQSMNAYGLFAIMTTERREIVVEGSDDGETWRPYRFRWKPQELGRPPRFTTPHMPRLDWQMWFAALKPNCRFEPWFLRFEQCLLEGAPAVLALLRENPFPAKPPRYLRARLYRYRFTHRGEAGWWSREDLDLYCPAVRL